MEVWKIPTDEVEAVLLEYARMADDAIDRFLPRRFSDQAIETLFGPPRFQYHLQAADAALCAPVWDLLGRGGKRWRPVTFLLTCDALCGNPEHFADFTVLLELLHTGSLIADDIEDDADLRRGAPAVHRTFGIDIASNAASALYFLPLKLLTNGNHGLDDATRLRIFELYAEELALIHLGQGMDIVWHRDGDYSQELTEEHFFEMCALKTGTLARFATRLAGVLCGASAAMERRLGKFAEFLGIAFQIRDDVLNLTGGDDSHQFTHDYLGCDITEGKKSLMVIHSLRHGRQKDRLLQILGAHTRDPELIDEAIGILHRNGSFDYARDRARVLALEGWEGLSSHLRDGAARDAFAYFVRFATERGY
jgi:geranylgeranyl pyrophosphate synthase